MRVARVLSRMKARKHYLSTRPAFGTWVETTVPLPGMLVWLDGRTLPILIGHGAFVGDGWRSRFDGMRVLAYARFDIDEIEVVDA